MKIITASTPHDAYFGVLEEMKKHEGEPIVVIAPDRFTASVERGLILTLGKRSSFNIEVMSFTRLANKYIGGEIKKCLTPEGSVMLIAKVIADCQREGKLVYYANAARAEGFANEFYAALTAIRNSGISLDKLSAAANGARGEWKRRKLQDIVTIYGGYLDALRDRHSDSTTRLEGLADYIAKNPEKFGGVNYFCTDINEFSAPEYDILKGLAACAGSLTVGLESGKGFLNARIYPDRVINRLLSLVPDKVEVVEAKRLEARPAVNAIAERLFSYRPVDGPVENGGYIKLVKAATATDEVLNLALDVLQHVREGGRYRDFEVFASDIGDYERQIKDVFNRYDIPFFIDKKSPLAEQAKARYLLEALDVVSNGFDRRSVIDFVKNPIFSLGDEGGEDSVFIFENFALQYGVDKSAFLTPFDDESDDNCNKKQFIGAKAQDKSAILQKSPQERVRERLVVALSPLYEASKAKSDVHAYTAAMRALMKGCEDASRAYAEKLSKISEYYLKCAEQVDKKIADVLDEIDLVLDEETDAASFAGIFKGMIKALNISLVPTYLDCVFIGDADSRFMGDGKIYVLGATNDKLPRASTGGAVLGMPDEDELKRLSVPIFPDGMQKLMADMFFVCDLLKKPRDGAVISYPAVGGNCTLRPSTVIDELKAMLQEDGKPLKEIYVEFSHLYDLAGEGDRLAYLLATPKSCDYLTASTYSDLRPQDVPYLGTAHALMDEEAARRFEDCLKKGADNVKNIAISNRTFGNSTSVSKLETFYSCPYKYFFKYILYLQARKTSAPQGTENGTILHGILERFFKAVKEGKISSKEDVDQVAYAAYDEMLKENDFERFLTSPAVARQFARVREEGALACEELYEKNKRSKFEPTMLEARVENFADVEIVAGDKRVKLSGFIDRVDVNGDKFLVIDYKSFKSADLQFDDVYYGRKLQLLIYMRAVEIGLGLSPAGVFYLPIYNKFLSDDSARLVLKGFASDDLDTLLAIDSEAGESDGFVRIVRDKSGELNGSVHMSVEKLDMLGDYAMKLAAEGAKRVMDGYIKPSPIGEDCKYCDFKSVCAYSASALIREKIAPDGEGFFNTKGFENTPFSVEETASDGGKKQ